MRLSVLSPATLDVAEIMKGLRRRQTPVLPTGDRKTAAIKPAVGSSGGHMVPPPYPLHSKVFMVSAGLPRFHDGRPPV